MTAFITCSTQMTVTPNSCWARRISTDASSSESLRPAITSSSKTSFGRAASCRAISRKRCCAGSGSDLLVRRRPAHEGRACRRHGEGLVRSSVAPDRPNMHRGRRFRTLIVGTVVASGAPWRSPRGGPGGAILGRCRHRRRAPSPPTVSPYRRSASSGALPSTVGADEGEDLTLVGPEVTPSTAGRPPRFLELGDSEKRHYRR